MSEKSRVDFWFDPFCPWSWITSRWILEAQKVRDFDLEFHLLALAVLNEDDLPPQFSDPKIMAKVWAPTRVLAAAEQAKGRAILGPLYTAIGSRMHSNDNKEILDVLRRDFGKVIAEALEEVGLPAELAEAATSEEYYDVMRRSIDEGLNVAGSIAGVPTIHINGRPFFGPVLASIPRGEQAGKLWDAVETLGTNPDFWELKCEQPENLRPNMT